MTSTLQSFYQGKRVFITGHTGFVRACKSVKVVINVTTDKVYENRERGWGYRENEPLGGYDPYSSSKACSELVTAAYRSSFFFNPSTAIASARAGNVIGGGDWDEYEASRIH